MIAFSTRNMHHTVICFCLNSAMCQKPTAIFRPSSERCHERSWDRWGHAHTYYCGTLWGRDNSGLDNTRNTKTIFMEILERIIIFSFPCSRSHLGGFGDHQRHVPGEIWCYPKGCPELRVRRWLQAPPNRNTSLSHRQVEPITNNNCWKNHLTTLPENTYLGSPLSVQGSTFAHFCHWCNLGIG